MSDVILCFAFYFFNDSLTNEMFERNMLFTEVDCAYWMQRALLWKKWKRACGIGWTPKNIPSLTGNDCSGSNSFFHLNNWLDFKNSNFDVSDVYSRILLIKLNSFNYRHQTDYRKMRRWLNIQIDFTKINYAWQASLKLILKSENSTKTKQVDWTGEFITHFHKCDTLAPTGF